MRMRTMGMRFCVGLALVCLAAPDAGAVRFSPETSRLFERRVDPKSGMVGYVLKERLGFNQQTFYFTQKSMTDDGRFLLFEVADEDRRFVKRMAMVDFEKDELAFVRGVVRRQDSEMAYLDVAKDELWYLDGDAFWKRELLKDPQKPVLVCKVPEELTAHGLISRMFTHLTLNRAKTKAFFDVRYADDLMVQGTMDFTTGRFEKWAEARGVCINHASINPVDDTLGLCAQEVSFTDRRGVRHDIRNNADGVYPRLQLCRPGLREMVEPALCNGATHETWAENGKGFIYCSCGVNYHDVATDREYRLTSLYAAHSTMTANNRYLVFDRQTEEANWYRGCPWNVIFWNLATGKYVYVYYGSPALNAKGEGHPLHPDPHPHFCCKDRYIVCTLNDEERRMNVFVAPVEPLIAATAGEKAGKFFKTAHSRRYQMYPEKLYNGIVLPTEWPPRNVVAKSWEPDRIPYLEKGGIPSVIPIDVGRQLFVDDFLVERTDLERIYPKPVKYAGNPVLWPETEREKSEGGLYPVALPKGGGLWWDSERKVFRLWYEASWIGHVCYAESRDGIQFERVNTDVEPGGNCVLPQQHVDSWSVVPDPECADPAQRWKLFVHPGNCATRTLLYVSADGIHWTGPKLSGAADDRSTMFYNPFRRKWCFSLRSCWRGRSKNYAEFDEFLSSDWQWPWDGKGPRVYTNTEHCVLWMAADRLDRQTVDTNLNAQASLYSMDAVAYESIMLGAPEIHWGPENDVCGETGLPKITDIQFAYSRDGFHFSRPDRSAAIPSSRWGSDAWDTGYVQPLSNLCVIQGDELWFYYGAFRGMKGHPKKRGLYANGATGFAKLRRDGFAGMRATGRGELLTRPVSFSGSRLFVNVDCPKGALRAEVLGADGKPLRGFSLADCRPLAVDSTKVAVTWKGGDTIPSAETSCRFRFELKDGILYSFWVSASARGQSNGYLAGGGPGYEGFVDR